MDWIKKSIEYDISRISKLSCEWWNDGNDGRVYIELTYNEVEYLASVLNKNINLEVIIGKDEDNNVGSYTTKDNLIELTDKFLDNLRLNNVIRVHISEVYKVGGEYVIAYQYRNRHGWIG